MQLRLTTNINNLFVMPVLQSIIALYIQKPNHVKTSF